VDFTRRQLEKAGIGCTASLGLEAHEDISSNDRENEKRGHAKLERAIAMARDVGAQVAPDPENTFERLADDTRRERLEGDRSLVARLRQRSILSDLCCLFPFALNPSSS
jgi:D-psicose/D-tagatose/L-ribulose 3-epimerase